MTHARATLQPPLELKTFDPEAKSARPGIGNPRKVAVFVAHGMGQQVRFETLEQVARAILSRVEPEPGVVPEVSVREVRLGAERMHRVELRIPCPARDGEAPRAIDVHLYEAYWAPLTEGRITVGETVIFLVQAGLSGFASAGRKFARWMFGGPAPLDVLPRTRIHLAFTLAVIAALAILKYSVPVLVVAFLLPGGGPPNPALYGALLRAILVPVGMLFFAYGAVAQLHRTSGRRRPGLLSAPVRLLVWVALATPILAVGYLGWIARHGLRPEDGAWPIVFVLWTFVLGATRGMEHFLKQFVGDVAIYLSGHRVNRFHETRSAIKAAAGCVARSVFTALAPSGHFFAYGRVIVMGHSLGSVIAYDTLNALLNEDRLAGGALRVKDRTKLFLTFGSPLDKTAFLFRTQAKQDAAIREALAASVQPMIQDYDRPAWINLYSRNDWISGSLEYYDVSKDAPGHVINREDPSASTPLAAHVEYWEGELLARTLHEAISAD